MESDDGVKKFNDHVPLPTQDDEDSEASFDEGDHNGLLDRLGVKIDDNLHKSFTA